MGSVSIGLRRINKLDVHEENTEEKQSGKVNPKRLIYQFSVKMMYLIMNLKSMVIAKGIDKPYLIIGDFYRTFRGSVIPLQDAHNNERELPAGGVWLPLFVF